MTGPFDDGVRQGDAPMEVERPAITFRGPNAGLDFLRFVDAVDELLGDEPDDDHRICACGERWMLCPDRIRHNKTEVME